MAGGLPFGRRRFNIKKIHKMNESTEIDETEVELCVSLALQWDQEKPKTEEEKKEDE